MPERRDVMRVVAEFALIVVGVVAALGVDRWVQGIDESRAEAHYLALLLDDAEANVGIFQDMLVDWEASRDAAEALGRAIAGGARPTDSGLLVAVARAGTVSTVPARDGGFRDLEASGSTRLISDPELRSQVVGYFTQEIRFGRPMIEDRIDLRFRTFARERVPPTLDHRALCPPTIPAFECTLADAPNADALWAELSSEPEVARMVRARHADAISGAEVAGFWLGRSRELAARLRGALNR